MLEGLQLLMSHGFSGYLIIATGFICILISIERLYFLFVSASFESTSAILAVKDAIRKRQYSQAIQICMRNSKRLLRSVP